MKKILDDDFERQSNKSQSKNFEEVLIYETTWKTKFGPKILLYGFIWAIFLIFTLFFVLRPSSFIQNERGANFIFSIILLGLFSHRLYRTLADYFGKKTSVFEGEYRLLEHPFFGDVDSKLTLQNPQGFEAVGGEKYVTLKVPTRILSEVKKGDRVKCVTSQREKHLMKMYFLKPKA